MRDGAPRSEVFDDVYFSAQNGLEETRHVFLHGNGLPGRWQGRPRFTIAETGFGTGLNFLAAAALFLETTAPAQRLDFISVEKYPLAPGEIREFLAQWETEFEVLLPALLGHYPARLPGFHRIIFSERLTLTLIVDDAEEALRQLQSHVDAWFLDGFKPSSNPDIWSEGVFREMARLSHPDTSLATFTVAGAVRRGLEEAGFSVRKAPGWGQKKDMLIGIFS